MAIAKGKIVASGIDTTKVLKSAKKRLPKSNWKDVLLVSVPQGLTVVYKI